MNQEVIETFWTLIEFPGWVASAFLIGVGALANDTIRDLRDATRPSRSAPSTIRVVPKTTRARPSHQAGDFGDLYRVNADRSASEDPARYEYVRPATRTEARAHLGAYQWDGVGVFAIVVRGADDPSILTPGDDGWERLLVHEYDRRMDYFIVRDIPSDTDLTDPHEQTTDEVPEGRATV